MIFSHGKNKTCDGITLAVMLAAAVSFPQIAKADSYSKPSLAYHNLYNPKFGLPVAAVEPQPAGAQNVGVMPLPVPVAKPHVGDAKRDISKSKNKKRNSGFMIPPPPPMAMLVAPPPSTVPIPSSMLNLPPPPMAKARALNFQNFGAGAASAAVLPSYSNSWASVEPAVGPSVSHYSGSWSETKTMRTKRRKRVIATR